MAVLVLTGQLDALGERACLVDGCTGTAFGPIFADADEANGFMQWLGIDARKIDRAQLAGLLEEFRAGVAAGARAAKSCDIADCDEPGDRSCANCGRRLCSEHRVFSRDADEYFCEPDDKWGGNRECAAICDRERAAARADREEHKAEAWQDAAAMRNAAEGC